jgi:hypothetical protein
MQKDTKIWGYLQFPLNLLSGMWETEKDKKDAMDRIISCGIVEFASRLPYTETAKRVIREREREAIGVPGYIQSILIDLEEKHALMPHFDELEVTEFDEIARDLVERLTTEDLIFYGIPYAKKQLKISGGYTYFDYDTWEKYRRDGYPMPMLKKDLAFDFRDHKKSEFDIAQLTGFLACKSILGQAKCKITNKDLVVARMLGFKSQRDVKVSHLSKQKRHIWDQYRKRYHFDKLTDYLEAYWGLHRYSRIGIRGFYIAKADKISLEDLMRIAETPTKVKQKRKRKQEIKAAQKQG